MRSRAGALLFFLIVAGCASRPSVELPPLDDWERRQSVLAALEDWSIRGRAAVQAGDDGFNARLSWQQDGPRYLATLSGPLGVGTVRLEGDGVDAVLTDSDGNTSRLVEVETELLSRFGWTLPVTSLRFWVLGIPDPAYPAETRIDAQNRLVSLVQSGWRVSVSRYRTAGGQSLPARIDAERPETRVTLIVDRWQF